jgi:lipopolysaccharide export system permease protein
MKRLDWYIVRQLVSTLIFSVAGLCVLFVVVHLLENLDGFIDRKTPFRVIALFYVNYLPEIVKLITPVGMLLAALFTVGRLSNTNEITAMKAGGMSVLRQMTPMLLFGALMSAAQLYFNGWIVPKAVQAKADIERKFMHKGRVETSLYNVYLRDTPTRNVIIRFYDDLTKMGNALSLEEYSSELHPRMVRRVDATTFSYDTIQNKWRLEQGIEHRFPTKEPSAKGLSSGSVPMTVASAAPIATPLSNVFLDINAKPQELFRLQRNTDELTFPELRQYIDLSERGGKDVRQQRIEYFGQFSLPFANFIVTLFGVLPLAAASSGQRKGGLAFEIAAAMVIAFLYIAFIKIGQTVALASPFPPEFGAWLAHGVFFVVGLLLLLRLRS